MTIAFNRQTQRGDGRGEGEAVRLIMRFMERLKIQHVLWEIRAS